ncbi:ATP-binding protein [Streptomyces sp. Tue6028]|uniref:ATP-binding protein n=1 Tax=Streptomyces sp. Tue6028 TaxID=2036037 RepID=UPI003D76033B
MTTEYSIAGRVPTEITTFVGRREEVAQTRRLLSQTRLLTLTGPGGVGKTRLAIHVAAEVRRAFTSGVYFVELAALENEALLTNCVASAMGVNDQSGRPLLATLAQLLADRQLLLILDNCEHLLEPCALLVGKLLGATSGLTVLATSRQPLGTEGETVLTVPPLRLDKDASAAGSDSTEPEAVRLFEQRATAAMPGFALTDNNRSAVHDVCRRLDGIPLAIELAAVRLRALSVPELLERLNDCFGVLTTGSRSALPRQQTLRATIDWSYGLCSRREQDAWARLSVFTGGFDLEAAEAVVAGDDIIVDEVFDLVAGLVDKSVVVRQQGAGTRARYNLLETLRQYGLEHLKTSRQMTAARTRHRDHYRALSARAREEWLSSRQVQWHLRLAEDLANLRTALDFSLARRGQMSQALEIASNLGNYWMVLNLREGNHWLDQALLATQDQTGAIRIKALWVGAWTATLEGDTNTAMERLAECRMAAQRMGDEEALTRVDQMTGIVALYRGDTERAEALLRKTLGPLEDRDDAAAVAVTVYYLGLVTAWRGEVDTDGWAARSLALCKAHGGSLSYSLWLNAFYMWRQGNRGRATDLLRESLQTQRTFEDRRCFAHCAETLAWLAEEEGRYERSAGLLTLAEEAWRGMGVSLRGLTHVVAFHATCEARLQAGMGELRYREARQQVAGLSHSRAVDYALEQEPDAALDRRAVDVTQILLTPRETEVAHLVKSGLSNKTIAARLVISPRTVESHIDHILSKLGFTCRAQIAAWATEHVPDITE